ncbi:DNA mismatch endonuclease Vsr [Mesorhizobium sp. B2-4-2]|uniref:very short patch repair endonuclease n=1 Tax=Mesorhizobium sp. B2-4-2 TaxID=2589947 RepID=UPI00112B1386|nr:very short patch repair endonuclease [Mesorhizobium sp. B2-4-2]TPL55408.1 DNA mismatch endonuclease Vsr [Mesorhizobium sp. B2-4-2]
MGYEVVDRLTPAQRSAHMAKIKRSHTRPERIVRQILHAEGYRFRLQYKSVPGRPDIAFPARKKAIMVHGCFWHAHDCPKFRMPKTRTEFWRAKFAANRERDKRLADAAFAAGWECLTVWECEVDAPSDLAGRLRRALGPPRLGSRP